MALPQIQPATAGSTGANTERVNAAWVQGVGPGYWPTKGTGLTLNLTSGIAFNLASGVLYTYAAATLAMTNATTNYVFLDPTASYIPAVNTTGFPTGCLPIATVITAGGVITNIDDNRTWFIVGGGSSGGGLNGVNSQAGDYSALTGDNGKLIVMSKATAKTLTLPAAPPSATWAIFVQNTGAGALTISRNSLTIDAAASDLTLVQGEGLVLFTDGTNYFTSRGVSRKVRTIGITIDGGGAAIITGVKGSIHVPFAGTIIGWSIEETSGHSGSMTVEVDKHAGTETVPVIPNTSTDKISASAPIALSSSDAAGAGTAGVSSWTTSVAQWDSIQFNVASATTVQRVTLYLRIQES
jgi:hypothetical protein